MAASFLPFPVTVPRVAPLSHMAEVRMNRDLASLNHSMNPGLSSGIAGIGENRVMQASLSEPEIFRALGKHFYSTRNPDSPVNKKKLCFSPKNKRNSFCVSSVRFSRENNYRNWAVIPKDAL